MSKMKISTGNMWLFFSLLSLFIKPKITKVSE